MEIAEHFLCRKIFLEHHSYYEKEFQLEADHFSEEYKPILFKGDSRRICFAINEDKTINNSYYVGVDWLAEGRKAVYVQPKTNRDADEQVNYLAMLFEALKHPEVFEHTGDLFEIKWHKPEIGINQQQDLLTPLLVVQYLQALKGIVRKGLKKSYYNVENNLKSRVKGKVIVPKTIKQNVVKAKSLQSYCSYDEFGLDGVENRILKKALLFIKQYLPAHRNLGSEAFFVQTFNYIVPAFSNVKDDVSIKDCRDIRVNPFYKEYSLAIELAKQILRRFGYNINNATTKVITTPPFWIDMSKLFELYVLGLLKDKYAGIKSIRYHFATSGNELDFLLNADGNKMVVDAKYKLQYSNNNLNDKQHIDVRQLSGYSRLKVVYDELAVNNSEIINCLIIYPRGYLLKDERQIIDLNAKEAIKGYVAMWKYGVKLPAVRKI